MNTRNRQSRRPVVSKNAVKLKVSNTDSATISRSTSGSVVGSDQTHTVKGTIDDLEVNIPPWINASFGKTVTGSELIHLYTASMRLHQLQQKDLLCDVNITVENTVFHAHKAVLAAASQYFYIMFTSSFQESQESDVSMTGKPEAFKIILDYIYSSKLTLTVETVLNVLEMAHYLQLDFVTQECEQFLIKELNNDPELDIKMAVSSLATAKLYEFEMLIIAASRFIVRNFAPTETFLDAMTGELLEEIMSRNDLKDEKQVFDTTLAWLQHDWKNHKKFAHTLLLKIRLGLVPVGHLSMTILKYPQLYAIKECRELIDKALEMFDACKTGDSKLSEPNLFAPRTMINAILSIDTISCDYYDINMEIWKELTKFPALPKKDNRIYGDTYGDTSCLSTDGHLYVSRGTASVPFNLKCPQFLRLDMRKKVWVPLQPMNNRRQNTRLVAGNHKIYAIGGDGDYYSHDYSCELYNIRTNKWRSLPSIDIDGICRPAIESCKVYQDKLLVYGESRMFGGGTDPQQHYLKMYDPTNGNVWTTLMDDMHTGQHNAIIGLVINDDKCYRVYCCECVKDEECRKKDINVEEIVINFENKTARIGDSQDQSLISRACVFASERRKAFRVNQDVYVVYNKQFFKTGIKIPHNSTDPVRLNGWKNMKQWRSVLLTQFKFDIEKWL